MKIGKIHLDFKLDIKAIFNYILSIVITAVIITAVLISLPLTESYLNNIAYNLTTKESTYWAKEYNLILDTEDEKEAEQTRNILFRRLNEFGAEEVSTFPEYTEESKKIRAVVQTSKDQDTVDQLIKNPFQSQIVTRKEDVDFDDDENPYAYLLASNYNATDWAREDFRNVYITELKDSSGEDSYFAIFKTWLNSDRAFQDFLLEHQGEYIGVNIDGYVTPYYVNASDGTDYVFAIQTSTTDPEQIKALKLLYNSGVVPTSYALDSETELDVHTVDIDYIYLSIGVILALLITYGYMFFRRTTSKEILVNSLITTAITVSFYIALLKILEIPIDLFILAIDVVFIGMFSNIICENKDSRRYITFGLIAIGFLVWKLGIGYGKILGKEILLLTIFTQVCSVFTDIYINMIKNVLKK